ncbi:trigger factor [Sutterella megalosphaeroides]|uniref:Trigger factor n=1 Tax=Sutterella megalosphaeroides TaxID=2494234 RepID=A0A2Z6ID82_9BURK|nr:trigger factor [Sutterella megalosphaeroides]BBF23890.1 trigger factor [Sutterella megalosphaeroides]
MTETNEQAVEQVEVNPLERTLELTIATSAANELAERKLVKQAKNVRMPGFRKGHVPMKQVRAMYGMQAFDEAINELVSQAWVDASRESGLKVAGTPRIAIKPGTENDENEMHFVATFEVFPEFDLPDLSQVELTKFECEVTDESVDATIKTMIKQRAEYTACDRAAQDEDRVTLDFVGKIDGTAFQGGTAEGHVFVLGEGRMLPEFEEAVKGMKAGEEKTFPLTFPENYGLQSLNGKTAEFEVKVTEVAEPKYPEVDEEFAKSLGVEGGVEALRAEIKTNLAREVSARVENETKARVMEAVAKVLTFRLPADLVANEEQNLLQQSLRDLEARGLDVKKMKSLPPADLFKEQAERRIRLGLFADKVQEEAKFEVTDEEIKARAERFAVSYENPAEFVDFALKNANARQNFGAQIFEEKLVEWVLAHAKTETKQVAFEDVMKSQF